MPKTNIFHFYLFSLLSNFIDDHFLIYFRLLHKILLLLFSSQKNWILATKWANIKVYPYFEMNYRDNKTTSMQKGSFVLELATKGSGWWSIPAMENYRKPCIRVCCNVTAQSHHKPTVPCPEIAYSSGCPPDRDCSQLPWYHSRSFASITNRCFQFHCFCG